METDIEWDRRLASRARLMKICIFLLGRVKINRITKNVKILNMEFLFMNESSNRLKLILITICNRNDQIFFNQFHVPIETLNSRYIKWGYDINVKKSQGRTFSRSLFKLSNLLKHKWKLVEILLLGDIEPTRNKLDVNITLILQKSTVIRIRIFGSLQKK